MHRITEVKIAGIPYAINYKNTEDMNGHIGLADFNRQEISINSDHTQPTQDIAVIHEIMHIISDAYDLGLTEKQVKMGTHALRAFLAENRQFLE